MQMRNHHRYYLKLINIHVDLKRDFDRGSPVPYILILCHYIKSICRLLQSPSILLNFDSELKSILYFGERGIIQFSDSSVIFIKAYLML